MELRSLTVLLGLDLGTRSAKALLLHPDGSVAGEGAAPYAVRSPRPAFAETDPEAWWTAARGAARAALCGRRGKVEAVGLAGQMHGVVLAGADGRPLRPAIIWADTRSVGALDAYRALDGDLRRRLGNPLAPGMAGPSLLWLRDHEADLYARAAWALQPKDWLRLRMTGRAASEPSDASGTLLYDLEADDWSGGVLDALGLRADLLAPLVGSDAVAGELDREAAAHLGLQPGTPVAAGAGDTPAAALGAGLLDPGPVQLNLGTGAQLVAPLDRPLADPELRTHLFRAAIRERWYAVAAMQNAGLALEWVLGLLGVRWDQAYELAFSARAGASGVTFLPYLAGERTPHLDPAARGAFSGLALTHGRADLVRAAFEGVAFAVRDGVEALETAGRTVARLELGGGGTLDPRWRQLLADVLERPLRPVAAATSARGAALLAGVAGGAWASVREAPAESGRAEAEITPSVDREHYRDAYARFRALYPALSTGVAFSGEG